MPKINDTPLNLRAYLYHGLDLEWEGKTEAVGDCSFCGREGKWYVKLSDGLWYCQVCNAKGNAASFLAQFWELSSKTSKNYDDLASDRKSLFSDTLRRWGAARSITTHDWLLPGYNAEGKISQLYRYLRDSNTGKMRLFPTPGLDPAKERHGLHGVNLFDKSKTTVYLCEGPWDGMALWELVAKDANVLAVPGCSTFARAWLPLFAGKRVCLMYDSDHPHKNPKTNQLSPPAGYTGMRRVTEILANAEQPPKEIHYLRWGTDGYDPALPHGYDVRDFLSTESTALGRINRSSQLLERLLPVPNDWHVGRTEAAKKTGGTEIELLPCSDWNTLTTAWRKALKWVEGLDRALSVMLATALSTEAVGDQLWVKVIAPAAAGKSTLCEALSVCKKYVLAKSTIRGFHSGFQTDRGGTEDNSLIALVRNKTLVTKDGDTLLQSPNLSQILSEGRDVYDRVSRTHYRNKTSRDYEGISMTWLLCGTSSLRSIDQSELGERFLDCVIVEDIDDDLEDEIGWRVANRADQEMSYRSDGSMETRDGPEMVKAKQLTGGYVDYLRSNALSLLAGITFPEASLRRCQRLAKFVALMRARPSTRQEEKAEREMSFRLISQLVRLAKCLAVVMNRKEVDSETMARVDRTALDTARGRTLELVRHLWNAEAGEESTVLAQRTGHTVEKERPLLRFLGKIGVCESFNHTDERGTRLRWRLTVKMRGLYGEVIT